MLRLVQGMVATGTTMDQIRADLPPSKTLCVDGTYRSEMRCGQRLSTAQ